MVHKCASNKDQSIKREGSQSCRQNSDIHDNFHPSPDYGCAISDPGDPLLSHASISELIAPLAGNLCNEFDLNHSVSNINFAQMRAILTAQKELRKPAASLYPSSSQISLIPETELIYKKYFPTDLNDSRSKNKDSGRGKRVAVSGLTFSNGTVKPSNAAEVKNSRIISPALVMASVSESQVGCGDQILRGEDQVRRTEEGTSGTNKIKMAKVGESPMLQQDEGCVINKSCKETDHARFKRRMHTQLLSLNVEVERQAMELTELRKEMKELRQVTWNRSTEYDSSKSRIDTLSKHVHDLDSKLDTLQV